MIRYSDSAAGLTPDMLKGFFRGWKKPRTPDEHLEILKNSSHFVLAIDTETGQVVGFVNALTDHVQAAFISLLEVLPEYQHCGIGTELMKRMLDKLKDVPCVDLTCYPKMQKFYAKFGMIPTEGMAIRRYLGASDVAARDSG
jgi:GNAT superfamily N-acetyltransferase